VHESHLLVWYLHSSNINQRLEVMDLCTVDLVALRCHVGDRQGWNRDDVDAVVVGAGVSRPRA
jgi:hypothetical protein